MEWRSNSASTRNVTTLVAICVLSLFVALATTMAPRGVRNLAISRTAAAAVEYGTKEKVPPDDTQEQGQNHTLPPADTIFREDSTGLSVISDASTNNSTSDQETLTLQNLESLLDPSDTVTTKLTNEGKIDWSYYDTMHLYHTRKAGGSSLFTWAKLVAKKHNLTVNQQEGTVYDRHDYMGGGPKVFVFTSLRPPVERAISSYEYDGLQTSNKNSEGVQNAPTLQEFVEKANDANNGVNGGKNQRGVWRKKLWQEGGESVAGRTPVRLNRKKGRKNRGFMNVQRGWIWRCATECYSKWFGGWPKSVPDTQNALLQLDTLEIVWMNNYQNPDYMKWLLRRWDAEDIPMVHKRKTANRVKRNFTDTEMTLLHSSNRNDELLYEALRKKWSRVTDIPLK